MKITVCSFSLDLDKEEQVVYCNRKLGNAGLGLYKVIRSSSSSSSLNPPPSLPPKAGVSGACKFVTVSWIHVKAVPPPYSSSEGWPRSPCLSSGRWRVRGRVAGQGREWGVGVC